MVSHQPLNRKRHLQTTPNTYIIPITPPSILALIKTSYHLFHPIHLWLAYQELIAPASVLSPAALMKSGPRYRPNLLQTQRGSTQSCLLFLFPFGLFRASLELVCRHGDEGSGGGGTSLSILNCWGVYVCVRWMNCVRMEVGWCYNHCDDEGTFWPHTCTHSGKGSYGALHKYSPLPILLCYNLYIIANNTE